ncbi:MAG TPA: chromate transporter [Acholeplasma sp.]|jgi:chromate transporter|nr:chromate transporter [Acholeplasma sp.]
MDKQQEIILSRSGKNWLLFKIYFLTSLFTFTGGLAMISVLKREIVDKYKLMEEKDFYNYAAISQTLPGVIAINNACFVGKKINGYSGMFIAALSAILPAFIFMLIATVLYALLPKDGPIYFALSAIRAISAAFIFSAALTIAKHNLKSIINILMAIFCFACTIFGLLGALELIVIAVVIGLYTAFRTRKKVVGDNA